MEAYFAIQAGAAVLLFAGGVPFAMNKVKPNVWAGFRTERTLAAPAVWYRVNRGMGIDMMIVGVLYLGCVAATYAFRDRLGEDAVFAVNLVALLGGLGWMVGHGFLTMRAM